MSSETERMRDVLEAVEGGERAPSVMLWELYASIQGESTWAGLPCTFVRLTGCPLRCTYCDTAYAFYGGARRTVRDVLDDVARLGLPLVEVTGGEPLAQPGCVALLEGLVAQGRTVLLETSGAISIAGVPDAVHVILDVKCPSSGEAARNDAANLARLRPHHEVKFVIGTREDFEFAAATVRREGLLDRCRAVLFSPVFGAIEPRPIVEWLLAEPDLARVRFQLQMHKFVWPPDQKGV